MTSIIKLHTISGAMDESPPCYILQVDEVKILLDCGWDEKFDPDFMKELKRHIHTIDAVLLSYPDAQHLGALPYIVGRLGLNCPIYATIPVYKMGQMFLYDLFQSHYNGTDFDTFTLDDVDAAFDKIVQLKYNQSVAMKGKGYGITITPLPAGHMIGGTIWKIVKEGEEDIVYAVDFNHKKERHLNGCELEKLQRPSLLITDAYNATYQQARRRARDEKLMTNILQTLRNNGNVLVAVDTAGRVLELAHMLDQLWKNKESGLLAYSLAFLNNVTYNVVEFAKSQIEWMSEKLMKSFEGARNNPFHFRHVVLCHSLAELARVSSPKVVLASGADMESGFSRELFAMWASNPNNSIILTARSSPGTLGRDLIDNGGDRSIELLMQKRIKLDGSELDEYLRKQREKRGQMVLKSEKEAMSSDSEDELEMSIITGKHDIVVKQEDKPQTGFFKSNKKQHAMFPFVEEKIRWDEYGEIIKPEDYKFAEMADDVEEVKENIIVKPVVKEFEEVVDITETPTKCISALKKIDIKAQVQYIDFEGRSDGESLLKILSQLKPRRIIVVRGSPEGTDTLRLHCGQMGTRVFCPKRGDIVDATTETHIYQVRLTDALVSQLSFQKGKEAEVAWMDAAIALRDSHLDRTQATEEEGDQEEPMEQDSDHETILTLEPLAASDIPGHKSVFINELKLADFKQVLNKCNISSEFSGGVLWCCNGTLAIRKVESGHVTVEGCLSEEYYKVRELLYEQYAIV